MARCGCGDTACNCTIQAGAGVTVGGSGSPANPYVISSSNAALVKGCGITGVGTGADPIRAVTGTWPYPCDVTALGGVVACDANGVLRSEPRGKATGFSQFFETTYANIAVPAGLSVLTQSYTLNVTNPDTCRPATVFLFQEIDVLMNMPANGGAGAFGFLLDETSYERNAGSTNNSDVHWQATKALPAGTIGPGATIGYTLDIATGRGAGGATYSRIQAFIRALLISV